VLTFDDDTFLLATMTWRPAGEAAGAAQKRRVCESLVREAVDLADRHGAVLLAMVGAPTVLTALGFEQNGLLWRRAAGR
jgi:predicted N-acetyltransferase YhbS